MSIGYTTRNPVGTERHPEFIVDDPTQGLSAMNTELVAFKGHPAGFLQVTPSTGVDSAAVGSGKDYPAHNTSLPTQSGPPSSTQVVLDAGVTSVDVVGLMIVITTGTGIGQVRLITAWNAGSFLATVNYAWATQPASGDNYLLLIPTHHLTRLLVKSEFSASKASSPNALTNLVLYDFAPLTGTDGTLKFTRAPIRTEDADQYCMNRGYTDGVSVGGYNQGQLYSRDCTGFLGAKIRVTVAPTSGKIAIWGAAS